MKLQINLNYSISEGDLKPYFDALQSGEALASACPHCRQVVYPARLVCNACGSQEMNWKTLCGTAQIIHRTDGAKTGFALVRFSGADTLTTVALANPESMAITGRLSVPIGERLGLWLELDEKI